jgi:hypothetical protein
MSLARRLVPLVLASVALAGCGRTMAPMARPIGAQRQAPASQVGAMAVAPDDAKVLAEDTRRAVYWAGDAVRVMAIHTTGLNTTAISSAANVYLSPSRYHDSQPCVFVARHFGFQVLAQYTQVPDYNRLAYNLKPLVAANIAVAAKTAFDLSKAWAPAQPASPPPGAAPGGTTEKAFFLNSRAILVQAGTADPEWRFYANGKKYAINARTKEMQAPTPQENPNDPLVQTLEADLQRASSVFLPTNPSQANIRTEPKPTN